MNAHDFADFVGHKEGETETVQGLITFVFGSSLDKYRVSQAEKLHLIKCAYRRMQYDRDVAVSGVRRLQKKLDIESQLNLFQAQK